MAQVGLKYPVAAKLTESDVAASYTDGIILEEARNFTVNVETADGGLWGSDREVENDTIFTGGTISFEATRLSLAHKAYLLGNALVSAGIPGKPEIMELVSSDGDVAPYVGFGIYMPAKHYGANRFRAVWLRKVKFSEPAVQGQTREEGATQYQTPTLEGAIQRDITGKWKREVVVDNEADAVAWLNGLAGIGLPADKAALTSAINAAVLLDSEDYTSESWVAVAIALADAQAVASDPSVPQSRINAAALALTTAQSELVERG